MSLSNGKRVPRILGRFTLIMIAFALAGVQTASAQVPEFEWSQDTANLIVARMSPRVYDMFNRAGLVTTTGTISSAPTIRAGSPGAGVLVLSGTRFQVRTRNGLVDYRGTKLYVVTLHQVATIARRPALDGVWRDQHYKGAAVTLFRTGTGYAYSGHQGCNGQLSWVGNTLTIRWEGRFTGQTHAVTVENNRIVWSNGNVWYR